MMTTAPINTITGVRSAVSTSRLIILPFQEDYRASGHDLFSESQPPEDLQGRSVRGFIDLHGAPLETARSVGHVSGLNEHRRPFAKTDDGRARNRKDTFARRG